MGTPACCCMFSNNVRHMVLLLATACITMLFANVVLFGLTTVLHDEGELSAGLRTVDSTATLHPTFRRLRRAADNQSTLSGGTPLDHADPAAELLTSEGHPIATHEVPGESDSLETTTAVPTTTKPRVVFLTRVTSTPSTAATSPPSSLRSSRSTLGGGGHHPIPTAVTDFKTFKAADDKDSLPGEDVIGKAGAGGSSDGVDKRRESKPAVYAETSYPLRALVYAAPGIGVLSGTFPATLLIKSFGARKMFFFAMILSAAATSLTPLLIQYGFIPLFLLRLCTGLAFSFALPLAGAITANWGTLKEQLTFIAVIFLFVPWAPIFSWNLAMFFYDMGVMYAYHWHAGITAFLALIFLIFHRDKPQYHNWVNGIELNRIVAGKVQELKNNRIIESPLSTLVRSISAWAIWAAMFGFFFTVMVFVTFLPTFFSNMDVWLVDYAGLYGSLPFFLIPFFYLLSGIGNRSICCSSTMQVRIWNSLSFGLAAVFLVALPVTFVASEEGLARNIMLALTLAPLGFVMAGALRSATLVGRFYAQHILAYMGAPMGLAMTVGPAVVLALVRTNQLAEWMRVFVVLAGVLAVTAVAFAIFGRGRSAGWAEHSWDPSQTHKMHTLDMIDMARDECGIYEMRLIPAGGR